MKSKKKSEFGKIGGVDLLNALYYFIGVLLLNGTTLLSIGFMPTSKEIMPLVGSALSAGFLSIFKNIVRNSDGEYFKKENN